MIESDTQPNVEGKHIKQEVFAGFVIIFTKKVVLVAVSAHVAVVSDPKHIATEASVSAAGGLAPGSRAWQSGGQ